MSSSRRFPLSSTHGMIDGIHGHPSDLGTSPEPAGSSRLADTDVFVFDIAKLTNGGLAGEEYFPHFPRRKAHLRISPFFGHQLAIRPGAADNLSAPADLEFHVMNKSTQGDIFERNGVARFDIGLFAADDHIADNYLIGARI